MGGQVKDYINIDPSTHRMKIIRWIALLIPLLLVAYSVFMQFSPLGKPTAVNMYAFTRLISVGSLSAFGNFSQRRGNLSAILLGSSVIIF